MNFSSATALFVVLAACGSAAAVPDADVEVHHGNIALFSSGAEVPPIKPSITLSLPDDREICATDVTVESCRIRKLCNSSSAPSVSAGELVVGTTPPVTIASTVVPAGQVEWYEAVEFAAGETLTMATDGSGTLPAMAGSVTAPTQVTVTSRFDAPIASGSDFELTWSGGTTGRVALYASYGTDGDFMLMQCSFPAASGHGTITAAAIQAYGFAGLASVATFDHTTVQVANWTVDFVVGFDGLWPDGSYARGGFDVAL